MKYKWKTNLGYLHCDHLKPDDQMYFVCKLFDEQVSKLRNERDTLKKEHSEELTKLHEDLLDVKTKYLELLKRSVKEME